MLSKVAALAALVAPGRACQTSRAARREQGAREAALRNLVGGWRGYALGGLLLLAAFYLRFGVIDGYAVGFTAFLLILAAGFDYLPRLREKALADGLDPAPAYPRWEGCVGAIWLLSFPFAPFLSWLLMQVIGVDQANWRWLFWLIVVLCIVVPVLSMLPLLRYLRRGYVAVQLTVLAIGTGFPIVTALGAAHDLIVGPVWQQVAVKRIGTSVLVSGNRVAEDPNEILLADGRTLVRAPDVALDRGPAGLLVLAGTGRIIAARDP